jgi:SAM-dependent methyltransferase
VTDAGEFLPVDPSSPWWGEHRSRYHFGARLTAGRRVLDVACGSGFGGPILLVAGARSVLGIDSSAEAIAAARRYARPGYDFAVADGTALPLDAASVEAITSFETIEHIDAHEAFVAELRRVLTPDGVLVLSTPNALHSLPVNGTPRNPFHVREFSPAELRALLGRHFSDVELLGQRPHPRYRPSPYWERPELLPSGVTGRAQVLSWKLAARIPRRLRDSLWARAFGRDFLPGEHDFVFEPDASAGHVLVAVCRP